MCAKQRSISVSRVYLDVVDEPPAAPFYSYDDYRPEKAVTSYSSRDLTPQGIRRVARPLLEGSQRLRSAVIFDDQRSALATYNGELNSMVLNASKKDIVQDGAQMLLTISNSGQYIDDSRAPSSILDLPA
jgi:hypothetical protein